jgi:ketosteroid isomerase-like protein
VSKAYLDAIDYAKLVVLQAQTTEGSMKATVFTILVFLAGTCVVAQGPKASADSALVAEVKQFILAQRAAAAQHDRVAYGNRMADEAIFVDGDTGDVVNKTEFLESVASTDGPPESYTEPVELKVWREGDLVFCSYLSIEIQKFGDQIFREQFRGTQIFRRSASGLKVVFFQATLVPNTLREPAKIDPAIYDKYVGKYSTGPGDSETVTREGGKLFFTLSGARLELKPIDATTFYVEKLGGDWVFVKNEKGEVTGLMSRFDGQNILTKKLP